MIPVYSIAKPYLASAVLALDLPLESEVGELVPNLPSTYATRRVASLLNHTSGLDDYGRLPEYHRAVAGCETAWSRSELLSRCESLPHANSGFQYSNIGYLLLRMAVEQHTGTSMYQAIKRLILDPLGITQTAEWETATQVVPNYDPRWVYSGTFLSEPTVIAQNLATLAEHRNRNQTLHFGITPVPYQNTGFDNPGYGFGFMCDGGKADGIEGDGLPESSPPQWVGHGGGGPGFSLMALVNTSTWQAGLEWSAAEGFDQTAAIRRLRETLSD
ncbi:MAG: serine hydrolase domain-containing protein [Micrococcales bacterium]